MKKYLREKVLKIYKEGEDFWDIIWDLNIKNLPLDEDEDDLDFENHEWIEVNDDSIIICAGGDWQKPMRLTIELKDNELVVVDSKEGFDRGMKEDDFNTLLFGTNDYEKILKEECEYNKHDWEYKLEENHPSKPISYRECKKCGFKQRVA